MKRSVAIALAVLAALTLFLLFVNLEAASTSTQNNSSESLARSDGAPAAIGNQIGLYLSGDPALRRYLQPALVSALRAKAIPIQRVELADQLPADAYKSPVVIIRMDDASGFWTPVYGSRRIKATIFYLQGRPVDREQAQTPNAGPAPVILNCSGSCVEGRRSVDLRLRTFGLVSLPALRAKVAAALAKEAADLIGNGLPANLNPEHWPDRATALAHQKVDLGQVGRFYTFRPLPGCPGGVVTVGTVGSPGNSSGTQALMYYDADRDIITDVLTLDEIQKTPPSGSNPISPSEGYIFVLDTQRDLVLPAGACSLAGWKLIDFSVH